MKKIDIFIVKRYHIYSLVSDMIYIFSQGFLVIYMELKLFRASPTNVGRPSVHPSAVVGTLNKSFLIRFLPNFIYGLLRSNSRPSLNMGFVP